MGPPLIRHLEETSFFELKKALKAVIERHKAPICQCKINCIFTCFSKNGITISYSSKDLKMTLGNKKIMLQNCWKIQDYTAFKSDFRSIFLFFMFFQHLICYVFVIRPYNFKNFEVYIQKSASIKFSKYKFYYIS